MKNEMPEIPKDKLNALLAKFTELRGKQNPSVMANPAQAKPTIAIIGAGIAGVTAALNLAQSGLSVCLIEARERAGGRIHTRQLQNGVQVELGAQFLHGIKGNPLFLQLDKYKIELKPISRERCGIYNDHGQEIDRQDLLKHIEKFKTEIASLAQKRLSDTQDRFTVEELKDLITKIQYSTTLDREHLNELVKKIGTHELQQETIFAYKLGLDKKESESNYIITNGFSKFIHELIDKAQETNNFELHLNSEVSRIDHNSNQVVITTKDNKTFKADALICTLPLGVLQEGNVAFTPLLSDKKQKAITKLKMTKHDKVIFSFDEVFWPNYSHFVIPFDSEQKTWLDIINLNYFSDKSSPVLVTSMHNGDVKHTMNDVEILKHFEGLFRKIFKGYKPPVETIFTHWAEDSFSRGSYCYHPEGSSLDDNTEIARPVGRLCFAGEHTHRAPASLQGAYLSGFEAARQVVEQLESILSIVKG